MDQSNERNIQDEARELIERMKQVPPREPGEKLRYSDQARILDLHDQGVTQEAIATEVHCHQSTVSRLIAEFDDTRSMARRLLNAKALPMAEKFINEARPADCESLLPSSRATRTPRSRSRVHLAEP